METSARWKGHPRSAAGAKGLKRLARERGWRLAATLGAVVAFYLVRDLLLYVALPILVLGVTR